MVRAVSAARLSVLSQHRCAVRLVHEPTSTCRLPMQEAFSEMQSKPDTRRCTGALQDLPQLLPPSERLGSWRVSQGAACKIMESLIAMCDSSMMSNTSAVSPSCAVCCQPSCAQKSATTTTTTQMTPTVRMQGLRLLYGFSHICALTLLLRSVFRTTRTRGSIF